jgi:hypothetical protein
MAGILPQEVVGLPWQLFLPHNRGFGVGFDQLQAQKSRDSGFGIRDSAVQFPVSGFEFRVSSFEFRLSAFFLLCRKPLLLYEAKES